MARELTIALGQIRPILGNVHANIDKHLSWIRDASGQGASLIVFPELGVTGYQVQDLTLEVARTLDHPEIQPLIRASDTIDVVFSFVEESPEHYFYVSSVYASHGNIQTVHRKVYLPTYGMFDEGRYFSAGNRFRTFDTQFGRCGMMICEDAWHMSSPYLLAAGGATLMIVPASSPARSVTEQDTFGSQRFWREIATTYAQLLGVNLVFANRVGFEDGINFFGGSGVVSAAGEWVVSAPVLEESLTLGRLNLDAPRVARYTSPVMRDEKRDMVLRELALLTEQDKGRAQS